MEKSNSSNKVRMRCPDCENYMKVIVHKNGAMTAKCNVCKAVVYSKQHSVNERLIRVISQPI